ncbi:MAG: hypothetical protein FWG66_01225 [Spirochaetes bacterium]|nr:hypothetical protein [Spirochaetota bacterium]
MIGIASVLRNAAGAVAKIRRVAAGVQSLRDDFAQAGGGLRGVAAGARSAVRLAFPDAVAESKKEIAALRTAATQEIGIIINGLRQELEDLRSRMEPTDAVESHLAAAIRCRKDVITASIECVCALDVCLAEAEEEAECDLYGLCESSEPPHDDDVPAYEPERSTFLKAGIQENFPHPVLRSQGCYFFTLFRWAEYALGRGLGEQNVIPLFTECVRLGLIDGANCFINDALGVLNLLCGYRRFARLAQHSNDPNAVPKSPVHARRVMSGAWPHFLFVFNGMTWDSLGANAHNYVPAGLREFE